MKSKNFLDFIEKRINIKRIRTFLVRKYEY